MQAVHFNSSRVHANASKFPYPSLGQKDKRTLRFPAFPFRHHVHISLKNLHTQTETKF